MLTPKEKQSLEHVSEVFQFFFEKAYHATSYVSCDDAVGAAAKLTEVYFANHHPDGTIIGSIFAHSEEVSE